MNKKDAVNDFVERLNAIKQEMLEIIAENKPESIVEITPPSVNDRVYIDNTMGFSPANYKIRNLSTSNYGTIINTVKDLDMYLIEMDDGVELTVPRENIEVLREGFFPMWGTLWSFPSSTDEYWLIHGGGLQKMADCGFRIYETDWDYYFGIDGAGYDFYSHHWEPLYEAMGCRWHSEEVVTSLVS